MAALARPCSSGAATAGTRSGRRRAEPPEARAPRRGDAGWIHSRVPDLYRRGRRRRRDEIMERAGLDADMQRQRKAATMEGWVQIGTIINSIADRGLELLAFRQGDRKSTRLNSSH